MRKSKVSGSCELVRDYRAYSSRYGSTDWRKRSDAANAGWTGLSSGLGDFEVSGFLKP